MIIMSFAFSFSAPQRVFYAIFFLSKTAYRRRHMLHRSYGATTVRVYSSEDNSTVFFHTKHRERPAQCVYIVGALLVRTVNQWAYCQGSEEAESKREMKSFLFYSTVCAAVRARPCGTVRLLALVSALKLNQKPKPKSEPLSHSLK